MQDHDSWKDHAHSTSWLTFDEIWSNNLEYYDNHSLKQIALDMLRIQREKQAEDVRIVFWFDS